MKYYFTVFKKNKKSDSDKSKDPLLELLYEAYPEIKIRAKLQELRDEVYKNEGEYAGKFTPKQIELLCLLKRDLEQYDRFRDI